MSSVLIEEANENFNNLIINKKVFEFSEQQAINKEDQEVFKVLNIDFSPTEYMGKPKYLGLSQEWTSYYIGASWLTSDRAVVVNPKKIGLDESQETDFIQMFLCALNFSPSAEYFSNFYGIDFEQPKIETNSLSEQLTPLLIVNYLFCLKKIVAKGLKRDYVIREENLKSKIRGRIMMQKNLQKNVFTQRMDRVFCRFQEYTIDIPINRLLKRALIFSSNYLNKLVSFGYHESLNKLQTEINHMKTVFSQVSDEIEIYEIKNFRVNKLYKEYTETVKLAKMILQYFDYSISKSESIQKTVPPFWIDMSRLFEVYVYSKLHEAYKDSIRFQVPGRLKSIADFVKTDEQLVLDAKYKTRYQKKNSAILSDIRELSGYARDDRILRSMGIKKKAFNEEENVVACVIIYPEYQKLEIEESMDDEEKQEIINFNNKENQNPTVFNKPIKELIEGHDIPGFRKFYKLFVELPIKK